jgi:hypothetical protein
MRLAYWVCVVLLEIRDYDSNKRRDGSEETEQIKYIDSDRQSVIRDYGWLRSNCSSPSMPGSVIYSDLLPLDALVFG